MQRRAKGGYALISRTVFAALAILLFRDPAAAVSVSDEATNNCRSNGDPDVKIAP